MNRHVIRTSKTDSVKGIPTQKNVEINLKQTCKSLPYPNVSTILSQRSVYEEERQSGDNFRLILTIVPYCTNVLFNPLTEIIKDEGSSNPIVITDRTNVDDSNNRISIRDVFGKETPTRIEMISDTEYSSPKHGGYDYHPGYDFFDNHILRNKTFKLVNIPQNGKPFDKFNTLEDLLRDRNGMTKDYLKRLNIEEVNNGFTKGKHLYLKEDVISIDESINQNLYEENGWWGFNNNTSIDTKYLEKNKQWESMDTCHAMNNYKACDFVDMYPDRTLFSFVPKFNPFKHREEYNWNVVITYPYKNLYNHPLIMGGTSYIKRSIDSNGEYIEETISEGNKWMGLKVMSAKMGNGKIGSHTIMFRTYTKHGLSSQDTFYLYYTDPYNGDEKYGDDVLEGRERYYESEKYYKVTNVGDLSRNNDEYFFYTSNMGLVKEIYKSYLKFVAKELSVGKQTSEIPAYSLYEKDDHKDIYDESGVIKTELLNAILEKINFRIRRCVSGVKSTYYIRLLRKVPNLRSVRREMTAEEKKHTSKFNGIFENYIQENAMDPADPKCQRLINNEQYQMGFAANIYNDNVVQVTFMDDIKTEGLTDNLGRPLSELFYTIIKNNAGYKNWYSPNPTYKDDTIEYSHCFGKVTSGFEMFFKKDDTESDVDNVDFLKKLSSAHHITNIINDERNNSIEEDEISRHLETDINYKQTFFYGDIVEFNPIVFEEKVLSNVMHRFNTAQRETINNPHYSQYQYHEIMSDDYDKDGFKVMEFSAVNGIKDEEQLMKDYKTISRPEGYIYKANYSFPIRDYTRVLQGSHQTIRVRSAKPIQREGILIQVRTTLNHNLNVNDIIFICDDKNDIRYVTKCVGVIDKITFIMSPHYCEVVNNASDFEDKVVEVVNGDNKGWLELCEILNGKYKDDLEYNEYILRRKNSEIPDYAMYVGRNQYVWRDIINIGDNRVNNLPDYIFANGYFYITNSINFYLKRQDPFGNNGLFFDGESKYPYFPNDPSGDIQQENNYIVKDTEAVC